MHMQVTFNKAYIYSHKNVSFYQLWSVHPVAIKTKQIIVKG